METMNTPAPESFDVDLEDQGHEAAIALLAAEGIQVISIDDGYVECPGSALHTTPTADGDCMVYFNPVGKTQVPCLHCFHSSCREEILARNRRLYRAALAGNPRIKQNHQQMTGVHVQNQCCIARPDTPTVQEILAQHPWSYRDIMNDAQGKVDDPPKLHYIYILSLFHDDDVVWTGRDVFDTGSRGHVWRFRPVKEWYQHHTCPGAFICPSTFKAGVHSRCEANVLERKYLVVESDLLSRDEIGSVFRWMESEGFTIRAIVDTAGKSLHGWFDYPDQGRIAALIEDLTSLKCDPSMFKASQPCRLPGAIRDGKFQRLIYFNH